MEREGILVPDDIAASGEGMISAYVSAQKNKPLPPADPAPEPAPAPAPVPAPDPIPDPAPAPAPVPAPQPTISVDEYNEMKRKLEAATSAPKPQFTDEYDPDFIRLGLLAKKDPAKFGILKQIKLNPTIDPVKLMVYKHISENPEDAADEASVEAFVRHQYNLDKRIPEPLSAEDHTEEQVKIREIEIEDAKRLLGFSQKQIEIAAKKVKSDLDAEFQAIDLPVAKVVTEEERKANVAKSRQEWNPAVSEIMKVVTHISLFSQKADKEEPTEILKYEIPADLKAKYSERVADYMSSNQIPLTEDSIRQAASLFVDTFKRENEARINHAFARKIRSMTEAEYDAEYSQPSATRDQPGPTPQPLSKFEDSRRRAAEASGYKF